MNMAPAAALTGALLVAKGHASPSSFTPPPRATVRPLVTPATQPNRRPAAKRTDGKTRVQLRVNSVRHLRLRIAAAQLDVSGNALMTAALDHYVDHVLPTLIEHRCQCLEQGRDVLRHGCGAVKPAADSADPGP